jgi:hypothetical protein
MIKVAQAHREGRTHHGLHQGGVVGQAREHLARLRGFKKCRALLEHMAINRVAQVAGDALTQPTHRVITPRREHRQSRCHKEELQKIARQLIGRGATGQPLVNQLAQDPRKSQRGACRQQQKHSSKAHGHAIGL